MNGMSTWPPLGEDCDRGTESPGAAGDARIARPRGATLPSGSTGGASVHHRGGASAVRVDDLEAGTGESLEVVQLIVVPAAVRRAADVPGRAIVREDHAVMLEGGQHDACLGSET